MRSGTLMGKTDIMIVTIHRLRIDAIFTVTAHLDFNCWSRMNAKDYYYCYCYVGRDLAMNC